MVAENRCHCLHHELLDCPSWVQCLGQLLHALELTLDCRKTELNWVELGALWWKIDHVDTSDLENQLDLLAIVYHRIIQNEDQVFSRVVIHVRNLYDL